MSTNNSEIETRLWGAADELRANSKLKSSEYSVPVLGLIFLRYANHKFTLAQKELEGKGRHLARCHDHPVPGPARTAHVPQAGSHPTVRPEPGF